jgi:hypothetical protein
MASILNTGPTVLHLAYKTEYFRSHGWLEDWIATVVKLLHADWIKTYKVVAVPDAETSAQSTITDAVCIQALVVKIYFVLR